METTETDLNCFQAVFGPGGKPRLHELFLVDHLQLLRLFGAATNGDTKARRVISAVGVTIDRCRTERRNCLHCDAIIDVCKDVVFCVIVPVTGEAPAAAAAVLCPDCGPADLRRNNALQGLRNLPIIAQAEYAVEHPAGHA